jgi:hypothetical protein
MIFETSQYVFIEFRSEFHITIFEISLCMYFEIFSCVRTNVYVLITISRYFFGSEKTTISTVIHEMAHIHITGCSDNKI